MKFVSFIVALFAGAVASAAVLDATVPGVNYEHLTVTGFADPDTPVSVVIYHDSVGGSSTARQVVTGEDGRFVAVFDDVVAGDQYRVEIDGVAKRVLPVASDVAEGWVDEDADTFDAIRVGTGEWSGREWAKRYGASIEVQADQSVDEKSAVVFTPTNFFPVCRGYRVRSRAVFSLALSHLDSTDGIFGVTVFANGSETVFAILDRGGWKRIPSSVFAPELGVEYDFEFLIDEEKSRVGYYLHLDDRVVKLGAGEIREGVATRFRTADFTGFGAVERLEGCGYDDDLIAADVHFDNDLGGSRLAAGCNFTNLSVTGWISVSNLWDTTVDSGTLRIFTIDRNGVSNELWSTHWDGFTDRYAFTNLIDSLRAGGEYKIGVKVEVDDEHAGYRDRISGGGEEISQALLARESEGLWFDEDGETVENPTLSGGIWSEEDGYTVRAGEGGGIVFRSEDEEGAGYGMFVPTNVVSKDVTATCTSFSTVFEVIGAVEYLPDPGESLIGVSLVYEDDSNYPVIALVVNGQWRSMPRSVFAPEKGVRYDFEVYCNETIGSKGVSYYVTDPTGKRIFLASYGVADGVDTRYKRVRFTGDGNVDFLRGACYDTSLVRVKINLDDESWDGTVIAGRNFTNLWVNGSVSITNLWETDLDSGRIRITITDSHGGTSELWTTNWSGFADYGFTNLVDSLTRGESYTIDVKVFPDDEDRGTSVVGDDSWSRPGVMARGLTDLWYDENAATVTEPVLSSGIWDAEEGIFFTGADNGGIDIVDAGFGGKSSVVFTPTNTIPRNTTVSRNHMRLTCSAGLPIDRLPDVTGALSGFTFSEDESGVCFVYVDNGVWRKVDYGVFKPIEGEAYDIDAVCTKSDDGQSVVYYVTDGDGKTTAVAWATFDPAHGPCAKYITISGEGNIRDMCGVLYDPSLVDIELDFDDDSLPGTNFTALVASGTVVVKPLWDTDMTNATVRLTIRDARGNVIAVRDFKISGTTPISFDVEGLQPGGAYTVQAEVIETDGPAEGDVEGDENAVPTAREIGEDWIDEDPDTFALRRAGTGDWLYRSSPEYEAMLATNSVLGEVIAINTEYTSSVTFDPTNNSPEVVNSTVRELRCEVSMASPGFYLSSPTYPTMRSGDIAAVTIVCDDLDGDKLHYAVYSTDNGGRWIVLHDTVAELNKSIEMIALVNYANPNRTDPDTITYFIRGSDGVRRRLAVVTPASGLPTVNDAYRSGIRFVGKGSVKAITGSCYDAHLASVDGEEYWTIGDALDEIGTSGRVLVPLWYSRWTVTNPNGRFGVLDRNVPPYLTLDWPLGYVVEITVSGDIKYYYYFISDYWIDWADPKGVTPTASGYDVTSAGGLAWLARESTNDFIRGEIRLAGDITNLFEHIWTPIHGFEGTFDGQGHVITGLKNGDYLGGPTNEIGVTAYGLFATASNSVFRNVAFDSLMVTNSADAVAALLGCSLGDIAVTNVQTRSGELVGGGRFIAGVVGMIGDFASVGIVSNFNAAAITEAADSLTGRIASGIANLASSGEAPGEVVITDNENRGTIAGKIVSAVGGGNVAQIVAGGEASARFASVLVADNVGTGDVSRVESLGHEGWSLGALPIVNLAAEVTRQSDDEDYKHFIEANDSSEMLIDPYHRTARMTGAYYQNGVVNEIGRLNDMITKTAAGGTVSLGGDVESWGSVVLDRPFTLDLNGYIIDNVFENYAFKVLDGASGAVVRNGTVTSMKGRFADVDPGEVWFTNSLEYVAWDCEYWERTLFVDGEFLSALSLPLAKSLLTSGTQIMVPEDSAYSIDSTTSSLKLGGVKVLGLAPLGYRIREVTDEYGDSYYEIVLDDNPATAPVIDLTFSPDGASKRIVVKNARSDCEYCLQSVSSLAEDWDKPTDKWVRVSKEGDTLEFTIDSTGGSGFYRISVRKQ